MCGPCVYLRDVLCVSVDVWKKHAGIHSKKLMPKSISPFMRDVTFLWNGRMFHKFWPVMKQRRKSPPHCCAETRKSETDEKTSRDESKIWERPLTFPRAGLRAYFIRHINEAGHRWVCWAFRVIGPSKGWPFQETASDMRACDVRGTWTINKSIHE